MSTFGAANNANVSATRGDTACYMSCAALPQAGTLTSVSAYVGSDDAGTSSDWRLAVYQGGASDTDPTGATLIWDSGKQTGPNAALGWRTISAAGQALAATRTWIMVATDVFSFTAGVLAADNVDFLIGSSTYGMWSDNNNLADNAFPSTWADVIGSTDHDNVLKAYLTFTSATAEQSAYQFRNDDGSESAATAIAAANTAITAPTLTNTRLRVQVNATGDLAAAQYRLDYKLSTDSVYLPVEVAGAGAASFGATGTATTAGTTAPTVAYPSGISRGDLLVMVVGNRPNASTVTTPSGWTAPSGNTATGGAGTEGAGTGVMRVTVFTKVADGTESGNVTLAITSGTSVSAAIFRCSRTTGKDWAVALASGSDSSAGTGVSITFGSDPGVTAGDLVFVAYINSEDTATFASEALTQTGMTYGTMTEQAETAVTTGNDQKLVLTQHAVTSGTSSAAAVWTATASGTNAANSAGVAIMIRARQVDAAIQLSLSSNVTASGEATTAQLTAPSGKTTGDFVTGRMQDDENPADTVDITADDYTELEWSIAASANAVNAAQYQFRVTAGGFALSTYTVTPAWTIGSAGGFLKRNFWWDNL